MQPNEPIEAARPQPGAGKGRAELRLEDVAAVLLGLGPGDIDALVGLGDALAKASAGGSMPTAARQQAQSALAHVNRVLDGSTDDPDAELAAAGQAIEQALRTAAGGPPPDRPASSPGLPAGLTEADEPPRMPPDADPDLVREFVVESLDHIAAAEASLLELETDPKQPESVHTVFRAFHTIKGAAAFLGLAWVERVAHLAENLLSRARDGVILLTGGYADLALGSCDTLKAMIECLEGVEPGASLSVPASYYDLVAQLADPDGAGITGAADEAMSVPRVGDILVAEGKVTRDEVEVAGRDQGRSRIGETLVRFGAASAADVAHALRTQRRMAGAAVSDATVRVSTERLDSLFNMVGELVIAQSMVAQDPDIVGRAAPRLSRNVAHTGKITRELQHLTTALRMVPLRATFQKMARLVRDLSQKSGKHVGFVTDGDDTEIDRNMVEALNDPLVHMIRNAVDHGVEPAEERVATGKAPAGTLTLTAAHSAGNVVIEVHDDGRGLDRDKIIARALDRGLIDPGRELSDGEVFSIIFQPGFSTAETVTEVSGRGVGMDVVRRGIESLRGRVDIASKPGAGSTFTVRLPLTMAITDAMVLRVGAERYLLPTTSIERSFRPAPADVSTAMGRGEMVMLHGELVPVFRLHELFGVPHASTDPCEAILIAIDVASARCALMVDELLGQQQVVIKSLGGFLTHVPGVAGGTILADGRVGLILDAAGILKLAHDREGAAVRGRASA